jgi:hypothetical protein
VFIISAARDTSGLYLFAPPQLYVRDLLHQSLQTDPRAENVLHVEDGYVLVGIPFFTVCTGDPVAGYHHSSTRVQFCSSYAAHWLSILSPVGAVTATTYEGHAGELTTLIL